MKNKPVRFDQVFHFWMQSEVNEIEGRDFLPVTKSKGFNSITEWRLSTALRLGMDTKEWSLEPVEDPNEIFPRVIIGPYQGWSTFLERKVATTFAEALEIPQFFEWISSHEKIHQLTQRFPSPSTVILFKKKDGSLIHIEGGHRMCAVAYAQKIGKPIYFPTPSPLTAAVATIEDSEMKKLFLLLKLGTYKQK